MAEKKVQAQEQELVDFEIVTQTYASRSHTRRKCPGAVVARTGYGETNTNGTVEIDKLITMLGGQIADQFELKFGANEDKGLVAGYLALDGDTGATTVKRSKDKKTIYFHIGHLFDKHPLLRPTGVTFCTLKLAQDKKGNPCIILNVKGSAVRKGRNTSDSDSGAAAGEQK